MSFFRNYEYLYPDLILSIFDYFKVSTGAKDKNILSFCLKYQKEKGLKELIQPDVVFKICNILVDNGYLTCLKSGGTMGGGSNYICVGDISNKIINQEFYFNALVYGFEYIYNIYKENNIVIPIVTKNEKGDISVGSAFRAFGGIVTAKHCIIDGNNLSIKGYSKEDLESFEILFHENDNLDLAFIKTDRKEDNTMLLSYADVTEDVLVMGYPKIPAFTEFLTAEKATISSKAESRLTITKGSVASYGNNYLSKAELMLVTAKIRGGNSGGPIVNKKGSIVGVACQIPSFEGDYDDLGYGIAVPINYVKEILDGKSKKYNPSCNFFDDYI